MLSRQEVQQKLQSAVPTMFEKDDNAKFRFIIGLVTLDPLTGTSAAACQQVLTDCCPSLMPLTNAMRFAGYAVKYGLQQYSNPSWHPELHGQGFLICCGSSASHTHCDSSASHHQKVI